MTWWHILLIASFFGLFVTCMALAMGGQAEPLDDAIVCDDEADERLLYDQDQFVVELISRPRDQE